MNPIPNESNAASLPDNVVLSARDVSKKFCRKLRRSMAYGIKDLACNLAGVKQDTSRLRREEFWALQDVTFDLRRGECLGLIGVNGSGKTTLLRLLSGIFPPDTGEIAVRGRVGALIALGAGFHPHMTGRENVYLNGTILGLSRKEIDAAYPAIVDFAEIGEFVDAPVSTYSSGMRVRLGFAVATAIRPDVLLIDEVLAVGDAGFRAKCYNRMARIQEAAGIIMVSHNMDFIAQMCNRVLHFDGGSLSTYDDPLEGIGKYNECCAAHPDDESRKMRLTYTPVEHADVTLDRDVLHHGDCVEVSLDLNMTEPIKDGIVSFGLVNEAGQHVLCWNNTQFDVTLDFPKGSSVLRFNVGPLWLHSGRYMCTLSLCERDSVEHKAWLINQASLTMQTGRPPLSNVPMIVPYQGHRISQGR